ncbi:hypothetical protein CO155_03685 [Candidatus Pacearchaeota archaeon CG_4_9_14_3_um_filter_35_19]|nr:MAG: hypothetical protein CO155_03685 [Candidatus Pacearchaeota archaeon CG_4_9_14_3_um_filter_35_19]
MILAIPVGFLIAYLARDELESGRKWFKTLIIISVLGIVGFWLIDESEISWTFGFIFITTLVSLLKSSDKKWIKGKFK